MTTTTATAFAYAILEDTLADGGLTVSVTTGQSPTTGYAVSLSGFEQTHHVARINAAHIERYVRDNARALIVDGVYLGTWIDDGTVYLDVSVNVQDLGEALSLARTHGQRAIYHIASGTTIHLLDARQPARAS